MPWIPLQQETASLKLDINKKFSSSLPKDEKLKEKQIEFIYKLLLGAKGKKQAFAILGAVSSVQDIKDIAEYGFENILTNDATSIKGTLAKIPAELALQKQKKLAQENLNKTIEGHLSNISKKYKDHQAGKHITLPVKYDLLDMATHYNNGEGILPAINAGIYIEWYPFVGSTRSIGKRFFTHTGSSKIWYTEGGTHGNTTEWWMRETADGDWGKKP